MGNVVTAGPNQAAVVSGAGLLCGATKKTYISGSWGWAWWCISDVKKISLAVITLNPNCEMVETSTGVPVYIDGVAQVRVMYNSSGADDGKFDNKELLKRACENFMGRSTSEMEEILTSTLDGHLRGIVGQMTPQELFQNREKFADNVQDIAATDFALMGIELISFQIQKIEDSVDYFNCIGRAQAAVALKEAICGEVDAELAADITEAECNQKTAAAEIEANKHISDYERDYKIVHFGCKTQTDKANQIAKLAYKIQKFKELKTIREEELKVDMLRIGKETEVAAAEVRRKEKELVATIKTPAEINSRKIEILASGNKAATVLLAEAEAEKIKLIGLAEAQSILAVGQAEAAAMQVRAEAMQKWGKAAIIQMILESLPGFASQVAQPLEKIDEIVVLGGSNDKTKNNDQADMMKMFNALKKNSVPDLKTKNIPKVSSAEIMDNLHDVLKVDKTRVII